jgi:hypothetical protein
MWRAGSRGWSGNLLQSMSDENNSSRVVAFGQSEAQETNTYSRVRTTLKWRVMEYTRPTTGGAKIRWPSRNASFDVHILTRGRVQGLRRSAPLPV